MVWLTGSFSKESLRVAREKSVEGETTRRDKVRLPLVA
jgi:hypothetical protein